MVRRLSYIIAVAFGCMSVLWVVMHFHCLVMYMDEERYGHWDRWSTQATFIQGAECNMVLRRNGVWYDTYGRLNSINWTNDYLSYLRREIPFYDEEPAVRPPASLLAITNDAEFLFRFEECRLRAEVYFQLKESSYYLFTTYWVAFPFVAVGPVVMLMWARLAWPGRNVFSRRLGRRRGDGG